MNAQGESPVSSMRAQRSQKESPAADADLRMRLMRVGRFVYLTALAGFVVFVVVAKRSEVAALLSGARLPLVLASLAASFGLIWAGSVFWVLSLKLLGSPVSLNEVVLATVRAMPARYLPLRGGLPIGRAVFLRSAGVGSVHLAAAALLEMAVSITVAALIGITLLAAVGILPVTAFWIAPLLAVSAAAVAQLSDMALRGIVEKRFGVALAFSWKGKFSLAGASAAYWVWNATTFVLYLRAFPASDGIGELEAAGAFMAAWAVGFLIVFIPQGVGVVEFGLVALLAVEGADQVALGFVFGGYRLVMMVRDGAVAAVGEIIAMRQARLGSARKG